MPTYGSAFRDMEEKWPHFKQEPRNLRISLAELVLIHLQKLDPFTWCGLFFLLTITFLHGCQ